MAMGAALKLKPIVDNLQTILAIEFLCAAQGLDYSRPLLAGEQVEAAYQFIRSRISHVSTDRVISVDIERMSHIMAELAFQEFAK